MHVYRSLGADLSQAKSTLSSWDSCMNEKVCKIGVIVGIVVGSLIVLSILFCLFNCCFGCIRCCLCLSCCSGCPGASRHTSSPSHPRYAQPPTYGYQPAPQYPNYSSQYNPGYNKDGLPAMPSWSSATRKTPEDTSDEIEMEGNRMDRSYSPQYPSRNRYVQPQQQRQQQPYRSTQTPYPADPYI